MHTYQVESVGMCCAAARLLLLVEACESNSGQ